MDAHSDQNWVKYHAAAKSDRSSETTAKGRNNKLNQAGSLILDVGLAETNLGSFPDFSLCLHPHDLSVGNYNHRHDEASEDGPVKHSARLDVYDGGVLGSATQQVHKELKQDDRAADSVHSPLFYVACVSLNDLVGGLDLVWRRDRCLVKLARDSVFRPNRVIVDGQNQGLLVFIGSRLCRISRFLDLLHLGLTTSKRFIGCSLLLDCNSLSFPQRYSPAQAIVGQIKQDQRQKDGEKRLWCDVCHHDSDEGSNKDQGEHDRAKIVVNNCRRLLWVLLSDRETEVPDEGSDENDEVRQRDRLNRVEAEHRNADGDDETTTTDATVISETQEEGQQDDTADFEASSGEDGLVHANIIGANFELGTHAVSSDVTHR